VGVEGRESAQRPGPRVGARGTPTSSAKSNLAGTFDGAAKTNLAGTFDGAAKSNLADKSDLSQSAFFMVRRAHHLFEPELFESEPQSRGPQSRRPELVEGSRDRDASYFANKNEVVN